MKKDLCVIWDMGWLGRWGNEEVKDTWRRGSLIRSVNGRHRGPTCRVLREHFLMGLLVLFLFLIYGLELGPTYIDFLRAWFNK